MKSSQILSVIFACYLTAPALPQESQLGTYLHGNWNIKGEVKGQAVTGTMNIRPAANGASQIYRWTLKLPDGARQGSAIGGIDPASGKVVEHGFGDNFYWKNTYEQILGDTVSKTKGTRIGTMDGEAYEGQITVTRESEDEFLYEVVVDNEVDASLTFTRAKPDGAATFQAYADLAVGGSWTTTIDGITYEDTYERVQDGEFVMMTSKAAGEFPASVTILGVDPKSQKFTWWGFAADGTISLGSSTQTKRGVWVGPYNSHGPDGAMTSRGRLTKVDDDTLKFEILEQSKDEGVPVFAEESIWKRK